MPVSPPSPREPTATPGRPEGSGMGADHAPQSALSVAGWGFLLGSGLLFGLFLLAIGQRHSWWEQGVTLTFRTLDASAFQQGMDVRIAGLRVGRVDSVQLESDAQARVRLEIHTPYGRMVGPGSWADLGQVGVVGSPYLEVHAVPPASGQRPLPSGSSLSYRPRADLDDLLVALAEARLPLERALRSAVVIGERRLPSSLDSLERTLAEARAAAGHLQREAGATARVARASLQRGDRALQQASRTLQVGDQLLRPTGSVPGTLTDLRRMADRTETMAARLDALVQRLNGSWLLPLLDGNLDGHGAAPAAGRSSGSGSAPQAPVRP